MLGDEAFVVAASSVRTESPIVDAPIEWLDRAGTVTPLRAAPSNWSSPRFSPDGRWVAYTSDESGSDEVYVTPFPLGSQKYPISTTGGAQPAWRRDGRALYYLSGDNHIMRVDLAVGGVLRLDFTKDAGIDDSAPGTIDAATHSPARALAEA